MVDKTIQMVDEDYDGMISYEEFKKFVKELDVASKLTWQKWKKKSKKLIKCK